MNSNDWKHQAESLYFEQGKNIAQISGLIGVSTVSISKHLNSLPHYKPEASRRKEANKDRRDYYREYKRKTRGCINYNICRETLKRDHFTAVGILSRERFFG